MDPEMLAEEDDFVKSEDVPIDAPWLYLDPYDAHLDARVERDGLTVHSLHEDGFQYLWKGVRANFGVMKGVYMYEVKVLEHQTVRMPETKPGNQNILRVGFSQPMSSLFLGDTSQGWAWGGTGKKSHNNIFEDYGGMFRAGDVIGCVVDMDQSTISFLKNGEFMGVAFDSIPPGAAETGLFPHLLLKNVRCQVNFRRQSAWFDPPGPQVKYFEEAPQGDCVVNPINHPLNFDEAEFIMMCGLPACGKTYWAQKHMEENPLKNYLLLGTNSIIDQMKVMNLSRQRNYAERWEELITQATPMFNKMVEIAGKTHRNIILDQTNVYKNIRRKKATPFKDFGQRICVTIVNDEDTLGDRTTKREREEGKMIPVEAVNQMRANFVAPDLDDGFTEIQFPELPEKNARELIGKIKHHGMAWQQQNPFGVKETAQQQQKGNAKGQGKNMRGQNNAPYKAPGPQPGSNDNFGLGGNYRKGSMAGNAFL